MSEERYTTVDGFGALSICNEGRCLTCHTWATIRSKINARALGVVQLVRHEDGTERRCSGDQARELRRAPGVTPFAPSVSQAAVRSAIAKEQIETAIAKMSGGLLAGILPSEGQCPVCLEWVLMETKMPPIDPSATWVIQEYMHRVSKLAKCVGRLAVNTRANINSGPATMAATPTKEDTRVDTQTNELRIRLRNARAEREMKIKTNNADAIVTRLDSLPAGSIVRFVKPFAATGGKPAGEYTYVAIKPVDGARWYTTGCDANPMTSDDLASFMVGGESVTSWDVLGDASETFQVPDVAASDTPAEAATDAGK